jgi:hypothetical protein
MISSHIWHHISPLYSNEQLPNYTHYKLRNYFMASEAGVRCVEISTVKPDKNKNKKTVT